MSEQVELRPMHLAAVRETVPSKRLGEFYDAAYEQVADAARHDGWRISGPAVGWYHGMPAADVDVAAGFPVEGPATGSVSGHVAVVDVPGGPALVVTHTGPYSELADAWRQLEKDRAALGVDGRGDYWEEYVTEPTPDGDPAANVTRLVLPLRT